MGKAESKTKRYKGLGIEPATPPPAYQLVVAAAPFKISESRDLDALLAKQRELGAQGTTAWVQDGAIIVSAPGGHVGVGRSQVEEVAEYAEWFA